MMFSSKMYVAIISSIFLAVALAIPEFYKDLVLDTIASGNYDDVQRLLSVRMDVNCGCAENRRTPMHIAVHMGREDIVRFLLAKVPNLTCRDENGNTALLQALAGSDGHHDHHLMKGHGEGEGKKDGEGVNGDIIKSLIVFGANVTVSNNEGISCLHYAAKLSEEYEDVLDLILLKGADVNAKTPKGETPLLWAVRDGKWAGMTRKLLEYGADISGSKMEQLWKAYPVADKIMKEREDSLETFYFDKFVGEVTRPYTAAANTKDLLELAESYTRDNVFGLYRILKAWYGKLSFYERSDLESRNDEIFLKIWEVVREVVNLEEGATDTPVIEYHKWKMKRMSWNLALASHNLNIDVNKAKETGSGWSLQEKIEL